MAGRLTSDRLSECSRALADRPQPPHLADRNTGQPLTQCFAADVTGPLFSARVSSLQQLGLFDAALSSGFIEGLFLRAKRAGLRVGACRGKGFYVRDDAQRHCVHLRDGAHMGGEVHLNVPDPVTAAPDWRAFMQKHALVCCAVFYLCFFRDF